ncbi:MAG: tripartite tricarboxylate transporter TctB family protein [Betaproteobacteria bacterium]|nr:tripartite tricarboxylate transporter TctB family protein [Betaproteobacteria bacterium]
MLNRTDLAVTAILLAICGWLYYLTTSFDAVSPLFAQDMPPERFPRMLLWVIGGLALGLPFEQRLRGAKGKVLDKARATPARPIVYVTTAFLVAAVFGIPWIGTFLVLIAICIGLPLLWGERRWKILVPYVLIFPAAVMVLFSYLLGVYFDPGAIGVKFP